MSREVPRVPGDAPLKPGHEPKMMQVPESKSDLWNVLVRVILSVRGLPLVATAADLIAADARFNLWFLENVKGKKNASSIQTLDLLELIESIEEEVLAAWKNQDSPDGYKVLKDVLEQAVGKYNLIMSRPPPGAP